MNLNKEFLSEIISYLINRGVTLADVLDTFNEHFNNNVKHEPEITNGDIDLLLCGREIEKQGFNKDIKEHVTVTENITESPYKLVATPPTKVSLSPNNRDYPTSTAPRGKGVSKARKMLFEVVEGKTVLEHLKANNINYKLFDTRIRKNWTMEKACTTPMSRVIKPYTKSKKPDNVKVVEESSPKTKMMLVNGRMTELEVSDTKKPTETLETKTETLESESNTEKATKNVTIEPQTKTDTDTRVNDTNANSDVKNSESERIEQLTDKTVRDIVTGKNKEKKKAEPKRDYTASDLCLKLGLTTHELREKIEMGELPQPDCGNKWSAKLLKDKDIILFF